MSTDDKEGTSALPDTRRARGAKWRIPTRYLPALPIAIATAILAWRCIRAVVAKVGEPCATLDDSFIHFQYVRAIVEGHPLRYQAGEPFTSGGTSILWPALLAPFYLVGFRGLSLMWPAWALSFTAQGLLSYDAYKLALPITGRGAALATAAMVLTFAGFAWCASSGMEVLPFAWSLARCARLASEWAEDATQRSKRKRLELVVMAFVAALLRPEGAVAALGVALTLGWYPATTRWKERAWGLVAASSLLVTPLLLLWTTGSTRSNTALVKLLPGNPYYPGAVMWETAYQNARTLVRTLLNGEVWSAEFLPTGAAPVAIMALVAIPIAAMQAKKLWRGAAILALALLMFAPCFYVTFLWNRLRYLWPFATGWLVGLACLAKVLGDLGSSLNPRIRVVTPLLAAAFAGALAVRLDWTIDDLAQSASGIYRQHVKIGRWAKEHLPANARIGVNDTGAIAYFSDRKTFDIVGLTTAGEGRYWVGGAASRIEHYERMKKDDPAALPTHFIVYPEWMGTDAVLGPQLFEATVTDSTILGGQSMRAYEADFSLLGSGEAPWTETEGRLLDAVDVADLDSEAAHRYELLGARDGEELVKSDVSPAGHLLVDGGRTRRTTERFVVGLEAGKAARGIVRVEASVDGPVDVVVGGRVIATLALTADTWLEPSFEVPADLAKRETTIELHAHGALLTVYHYWFFTRPD